MHIIKHLVIILIPCAFSAYSMAMDNTMANQGLYTNGQWDAACDKCWPYPHTRKNNHCKASDCALQGYYHCKPQDPPLSIDDDSRLIGLIKSGDCTYVHSVSLNEGEKNYLKNMQICTNVLDKMAGR